MLILNVLLKALLQNYIIYTNKQSYLDNISYIWKIDGSIFYLISFSHALY